MSPTTRRILLLVSFLALAVAIYTTPHRWHADDELWLDELHTAWTVSGDFQDVAPRAQRGNTSPLYFWLQWCVVQCCGLSEQSLRIVSYFSAIGAIWLIGWLVWLGTRSGVASLFAMMLAMIDPQFLYFGREARVYALLQFVSLLQILVLYRTVQIQARIRWHMLLVLLSVLLFYLHYTSLLLLVAEVIFVAILMIGSRYKPSRWLLLDGAIVALLCLPALGHVLEVAGRRDNWAKFIDYAAPSKVAELFAWHVQILFPALALGLVVAVRHFAGWRPLARPVGPRFLLLALLWTCVPVTLAFALNNLDIARLFERRWLMIAAGGPIVLGSICCAAIVPHRAQISITVALIVLANCLVGPAANFLGISTIAETETPVGWKAAIEQIETEAAAEAATANWPVLVASGLIEADELKLTPNDMALREYCLLPVSSIYQIDQSRREVIPLPYTDPGFISKKLANRIGGKQGVYLLLHGDEQTMNAVLDQLDDSLQTAGWLIDTEKTYPYGLVTLARLRIVPLQDADNP